MVSSPSPVGVANQRTPNKGNYPPGATSQRGSSATKEHLATKTLRRVTTVGVMGEISGYPQFFVT